MLNVRINILAQLHAKYPMAFKSTFFLRTLSNSWTPIMHAVMRNLFCRFLFCIQPARNQLNLCSNRWLNGIHIDKRACTQAKIRSKCPIKICSQHTTNGGMLGLLRWIVWTCNKQESYYGLRCKLELFSRNNRQPCFCGNPCFSA